METGLTLSEQDIDLDRETFLLQMILRLAETIEGTIGLEGSEAFISAVGSQIGNAISGNYPDSDEGDSAPEKAAERVAAVCVDLKARIKGGFSIESIEGDRIVLVNTRCPFGERVKGHPSLCMMTTHVFGRVAANRTGYAVVHIGEAIALGDGRCRVVIALDRNMDAIGCEFFS